jgi:transposase-like protein
MQQDTRLGERMLEILLAGVSTRKYETVIPEIADTAGVSKSSVSREFVEASAEELKRLNERRFDDVDLLVIYLDGMMFGSHHVVGAVGVDVEGDKYVLGVREGASENAVVVKDLLESLVERGVKPGRRRLFVTDGSKALRTAIDQVYGSDNPVQRCRNHKMTNVTGYLPKKLQEQVLATMRAAYRLPAEEGKARICKQADWLSVEYPSAAASLLEGLEETFTINRLGLPRQLQRCLATTNIIESSNSTVRLRTRRVSRWRNSEMAARWAGAAFLEAEKNFRKIVGFRHLWILKAALDRQEDMAELEAKRKVG